METLSHIKRRRVTHIIPGLPFGGAERFLVDLTNMMVAQYNIDIHIILFRDIMPMAAQLDDRIGLTVVHKKKVDPFFVSRLAAAIQNTQPDIVHTHLWGSDVYGGAAADRLGIPWVSTEHNVNVNESRIKHWIKARALRSAREIMITSEDERMFCKAHYALTDERMRLLPYYISLHHLLDQSPLPVSQPLQFLLVGRLVPQKGIDTLLPALGAIKARDWQLTIVGIGPEASALRAQATALGLDQKITWQQPSNAIADVYAAHHILLVPSRWEGFGIVGLEAQAAGLPVVGHRVGGMPEYVQDGKTGILVDPTTTSWVSALESYLDDRERITREQHAAKEWIRAYYAADTIARAYYDWYTTHIS